MASALLSGPALEPLTLAEAKAFLRVEHGDDDLTIAALIAGSRIHVEMQTRRAMITQIWRLIRDGWPADGRLMLSPTPLQEILAARIYESDGMTLDIDLQVFVADKPAGIVGFAPWAVPLPGRAVGGIELDMKVGYGDSAADVPEPLRHAVRLLVAHWYENRHARAGALPIAVTPAGIGALIAPYRVQAL
jgi:uncharacterized phiE125 gp8 family phage protein